MSKHLLHKRSNALIDGKPKLPTADIIEYGEIAINYAKGQETISIKNANDEIITLPFGGSSSGGEYVAKSGDTMSGQLNIEHNLNIGSGNTVSGQYAMAQGNGCTASGRDSHAEGRDTIASGRDSHAEGQSTTASGMGSHAEGFETKANGGTSHAEGATTIANGNVSHAEGRGTIANNYAEHASGSYNVSISGVSQNVTALTADTQATLFSIGNGDSGPNRKNAFEVKWNADAYFSGDTKFAKGITASTMSSPTIDAKQDLLVSGANIKTINGEDILGSGNLIVIADSSDKVAKSGDTMSGALIINNTLNVGDGNTVGGLYSMVQGRDCVTVGNASHAEGYSNTAQGDYSHVEGNGSVASGVTSHAEGNQTKSMGAGSHSEGSETIATGQASHAEGSLTKSIGSASHSEGLSTIANAIASHAEGANTVANNPTEHASGSFNKSISGTSVELNALSRDANATLFSVGNGTTLANARNAFEVKWNADAYFSGDTKFAKGITANTITSPTIDTINSSLTNISSNVYNKTETDDLLLTKADVNTTYTKTEINNQLLNKVNVNDVYSKLESDTALALKADKTTTYTKVETDAKLDTKADKTVLDTFTATTNTALDTKVDKVVGKGLSTNDYTNEDKTKLDSLSNYDDTNVKKLISDETTRATTAEGLLETNKADKTNVYTKAESDTSLLLKQDNLVSGTSIKTINGETLLGNGDIVIIADSSDKVAKSGDTMSGQLNIKSKLNVGSRNIVSGTYAFVQGEGCTASGEYSHAEGNRTTARGFYSHAEGGTTIASGECSHAEGASTIASGHYSHAEGVSTIASGSTSHAEGDKTTASGYSSHAEGQNTIANNRAEHASGAYNISTRGASQQLTALTADTQATLFSIGNGTSSADTKNAVEVKWNGDTYISGNTSISKNVSIGTRNTFTSTDTAGTVSNGEFSFAQGKGCVATGKQSHAQGESTKAIGSFSHAEGALTQAIGNSSHAEGLYSIASGTRSHAEGEETIASGIYSHAEGHKTQAIALSTHVEGENSIASGNTAHAEGYTTVAGGLGSHAEGQNTVATGAAAHAEGGKTLASGNYSHAEGEGTIANSGAEHASGRWNVSNGDTLFSIGNGVDNVNRQNAFELKNNGDTYISGDTKVSKGLTAATISATTITSPTIDAKQDLLVSGTSIKTINGTSLLGNGDIAIALDAYTKAESDTLLDGKQAVGDYATKTELTDGLSTKVSVVELVHDAVDTLHYTLMVDSVNKGEINIPKDQFLKSASYDDTTKELIFVFDTESGETTTKIDVSNLVDIYVAGNGLSLASNVFSIDEAIVATNDSVDAKLALKQAVGDYATKTEVGNYVAKSGDTMSGALNIMNNINIGSGNTVSGAYAMVQGKQCTAIGKYAFVQGDECTANGICSHAEGEVTIAHGYSSHAEGSNTIANNNNEHASGRFNISISGTNQSSTALTNDGQSTLFSIGNGDIFARKNAVEIKNNGDAYFSGDTKFAKGITATTISSPSLNAKQDILVSGTSIKTINGTTLLGGGNMVINANDRVSKGGDTMTGDLIIQSSINIGSRNTAGAQYVFVQGTRCIGGGDYSHAEGSSTTANGDASHAEGSLTTAVGDFSHSEGASTNSTGHASHSEGSFTKANGASSHAEGTYTIANNVSEHANGSFNTSTEGASQQLTALTADTQATLFSIGNGSSESDRKNALEVKWNGDVHITGNTSINALTANTISSPTIDAKQDILVSGTNIKTINGETLLGNTDIVIVADTSDKVAKTGDTMTGILNIKANLNVGENNIVSGFYTLAQGSGCTASGRISHAQGSGCTASGVGSHAEGERTIANGNWSHAEGIQTTASGISSHAEGIVATANGYASHAEGEDTRANGQGSHAEGNGTRAIGTSSHAEGRSTTASGLSSHAEGEWTIANNTAEHASGSYNVSTKGVSQFLTALTNDSQATLFSIGNGTATDNRKNAFEVKWNGDTYISKTLNVGSGNTVTGLNAMAQGSGTGAIGTSSHAEGDSTAARGIGSHAEGSGTTANGDYSHAEGVFTVANGIGSHAEGSHTITNNEYEHASGFYNVSNATTIFSVGNGGGELTRSNALELTKNGELTISGSINQSSDRRLKHDIRPLEDNVLDKVMEMNPSRYIMNDSDEEEIGFIAQEMEEVFPEFVTTNVGSGMKSVKYSVICSVLCKAIQELKSEIDVLKANQK